MFKTVRAVKTKPSFVDQSIQAFCKPCGKERWFEPVLESDAPDETGVCEHVCSYCRDNHEVLSDLFDYELGIVI